MLCDSGRSPPFARRGPSLIVMEKRTQTFQAIFEEVARGGDRSSLFWFLVKHHDELLRQAEGKRLRWNPLCKRFAEHGLTDARGKPATAQTAQQTWLRARKAVADAKKRKQASDPARRPGAVYPSRISPDWRPTVVPPRPATAGQQASSSRAVLPSGHKSLVDPNDPPMCRPRWRTSTTGSKRTLNGDCLDSPRSARRRLRRRFLDVHVHVQTGPARKHRQGIKTEIVDAAAQEVVEPWLRDLEPSRGGCLGG